MSSSPRRSTSADFGLGERGGSASPSASVLTAGFLLAVFLVLWRGIGIWGVNTTVVWGFAIADYVWWIGIGNAGTLISGDAVANAPDNGEHRPIVSRKR